MYTKLNTKVNNSGDEILDASILIQINQYNADKQYLDKIIGDVKDKIPDISSLVTTTVFNIKIGEVENKISDTCDLVTTASLNTKI